MSNELREQVDIATGYQLSKEQRDLIISVLKPLIRTITLDEVKDAIFYAYDIGYKDNIYKHIDNLRGTE